MSQEDVAAETETTQSNVSLWEHEKRKPGLSAALKLQAMTGGLILAEHWEALDAERRAVKRAKKKRRNKRAS